MKIAIGCDHGGIVLKPAVEEVLKAKNIEPQQINHYKLMTLDDLLIPPPEPLSCDDEILRCNDNDFESLFDLQKKYIVKEVAPANKQVSDL